VNYQKHLAVIPPRTRGEVTESKGCAGCTIALRSPVVMRGNPPAMKID